MNTLLTLCIIAVTVAFAADLKPPKETPQLMNEGKKIFEQTCSPCHGSKGDGKGPAGAALKPSPTDFQKPFNKWPNTKGSPEKIFEVITKGIPNSAMVAWSQFSEQQRWALTYVVRSFSASGKKK